MTETVLTEAELEGMTRAQILDLCKARGLSATAWKRGRMIAVLTGQEEAPAASTRVKKESGNVLAQQLARRDQVVSEDISAKLAKRTGACQSASACECTGYAKGRRDAFGWQMCVCQHTQWAHAVPAEPTEPADG